jgi:hypothetical protein
LLSEIDEKLGGGVLNFQLFQDRSAIVRCSNITDIIHQHLIQTFGTKRGLDGIGNGNHGSDC